MLQDASKRNLLIFVAIVAVTLGGSQLIGYVRLSAAGGQLHKTEGTSETNHLARALHMCMSKGGGHAYLSACDCPDVSLKTLPHWPLFSHHQPSRWFASLVSSHGWLVV